MSDHVAILDIGKTLAKLSLWSRDGRLLERRTRPNRAVQTESYVALDVEGIEAWLEAVLSEFATGFDIGAIVPVGHGAAGVLITDGKLAAPAMDYEHAHPEPVRKAYERLRDPFHETGSPRLPGGLNFGAQLYYLEKLFPEAFTGTARILPWAQFWAWNLSGVAASEVTSLACHTDLWCPLEHKPSSLAVACGWAERLAPLRRAGDILGSITPSWASRTGLPKTTRIHCGIHDSNAALTAARGFPEMCAGDSTVLSTGTWFISMRSPEDDGAVNLSSLPEARDCLVTVDIAGKPIPTARFMGGREIETLIGLDTRRIDIKPDQAQLLDSVHKVLETGAMVLPTFASGCGPFPHGRGRWVSMPEDRNALRAGISLYAAMVVHTSLDLIGTKDTILIEGRFAEAQVFVRALASLRPQDRIYTSCADSDVSYGALRLLEPDLPPICALTGVEPLPHAVPDYYARWALESARMEA